MLCFSVCIVRRGSCRCSCMGECECFRHADVVCFVSCVQSCGSFSMLRSA